MDLETPKNTVKFLVSGAEFRSWLEENHAIETALVLGFYKKNAKREGITYAEALDEALCFGWIDGVRKSLDAQSYSIRFTPRKSRSIWSRVNIKHVERLMKAERMAPAGLRAYEARDPERTGIYSFENGPRELSLEESALFKTDREAWRYFSTQAPSYQRVAIFWVISAKKSETRVRRLARLMEDSKAGRRISVLVSKKAK